MLSQFDWRLRGGLFVMLFSPFSEPANFSQFPIDCLFADLQVGRECFLWRLAHFLVWPRHFSGWFFKARPPYRYGKQLNRAA